MRSLLRANWFQTEPFAPFQVLPHAIERRADALAHRTRRHLEPFGDDSRIAVFEHHLDHDRVRREKAACSSPLIEDTPMSRAIGTNFFPSDGNRTKMFPVGTSVPSQSQPQTHGSPGAVRGDLSPVRAQAKRGLFAGMRVGCGRRRAGPSPARMPG